MATARLEGDSVVLTIPLSEAQSLRVALQPCLCKHPKSHSTAEIRDRFVRGIGMAMDQKNKEPRNERNDTT